MAAGAECDAETEDAAEASEAAAAAARVRPPTAKTKQLGCHDQETEEKLTQQGTHHGRLTFGPHGTPAAGSSGSSGRPANGQRGRGAGDDGGGRSGKERS